MTIAAGIRFAKGILICADSEITYGTEYKGKGSKIWPYKFKKSGNKAIFTFSGTVALCKQCIQKIARELASAQPSSLSDMEKTLSTKVDEFHQQYVFKHPHFGYESGPSMNLIAALWSAEEGKLGLFQSEGPNVFEVTDKEKMAITGSGGTFAQYIAGPLVPHDRMKLTDVITAAVYAIKEAKDNVPGCGKGSELIAITEDGHIGNAGYLHSSHVEDFAASFENGIKHLFVETCDLDTPEKQVKERLDGLWMVIQSTRNYLLREREKGGAFASLVDTIIGRKITEI